MLSIPAYQKKFISWVAMYCTQRMAVSSLKFAKQINMFYFTIQQTQQNLAVFAVRWKDFFLNCSLTLLVFVDWDHLHQQDRARMDHQHQEGNPQHDQPPAEEGQGLWDRRGQSKNNKYN